MRIVAGSWRGRRLATPSGNATRPTADRVRETLFNMLASRIGSFEGLRVADLFAGSGALGFEALSRGAAEAVFVETDHSAIAAIQANSASLGAAGRVRIEHRSALSLPAARPFDLVFADPPYAGYWGSAVVHSVLETGWLAPGGWLALETERSASVAGRELVLAAERIVGRARLWLFRRP